MTEKTMRNNYIAAIIKTMGDSTGKVLLKKKLPAKLLYALRRSLPEIEKAYKACITSMEDICKQYGTTPDKLDIEDKEEQVKMLSEIDELFGLDVTVNVHTVSADILDKCGEGAYDSLTYDEIDRLWWLFDEE